MEPEISYYIVGTLPVKYIRDVEREIFFVKKFDRKTGCFINGGEYLGDISHSTSDIEEVTKEEFIQQLEELRSRFVKTEGDLKLFYDELRTTIDVAYIERRRHTPQERHHIAELCQKSYQLFESTIGRSVCGHAEEYE